MCAIAKTQAPCATETETMTALHPLSITVTVNHTPDVMVNQGSNFDWLLTVWMVGAIVLLVIAVSAIILSILLGYLLCKKRNTVDKSSSATSNPNTIELVTKGEPQEIVEDDA